ncbi:unnamed protein product [Cercospora beticola]|nr:unnamed protein product [Cercospora beticola]
MPQYFYLDANIKAHVPESQYKRTQRPEESNDYAAGDIIEAWDHVFRWDKDCISDGTMQIWRSRGDALADAALPEIKGPAGDAGGSDLLARLEAAANKPKPAKEVTALWEQLNSIGQTPFSYDREQILRGQAVFYRYAPQILASLLQFSLSAGFSSPSISRLLNLTSYLVPPMSSTPEGEAPRISKASNDRTYMRLMETTQFVLDCMSKDAMEVDNAGWRSAVRVRLLHATMRSRLLARVRGQMSKLPDPPYREDRDGVPLSQEDMAGTLASFSGAPLLNVMKVGIMPSLQECEDYTALWRVIGYYMGIDTEILSAHMSSWHQCSRLTACSIVNIFAGESFAPPAVHFPMNKADVPKYLQIQHQNSATTSTNGTKPDVYTTPATLPVLYSVVNRWPSPFTFQDQAAAARRLMGETLADWLSVPRTSLPRKVYLYTSFAVLNIPPTFSQYYRSGWDAKRRNALQRSAELATYELLGDRKTKFRARGEGEFEPRDEKDEFGKGERGWLRGIGIALEWSIIIGEMILVLGILAPVLVPFLVCSWILNGALWDWHKAPLLAGYDVLVPT